MTIPKLRNTASPTDSSVHSSSALFHLKSLAEASVVFAALTFVGGLAYFNSYYSSFGLNAADFDLTVPATCAKIVYVLLTTPWSLLLLCSVSINLLLLFPLVRPHMKWLIAVSLLFLIVGVPLVGSHEGRRRANAEMLVGDPQLPLIAFQAKETSKLDPKIPCVANDSTGALECKLLLHSKGVFYFFKPIPRAGTGVLGASNSTNLNIYLLPDAEVIATRIERGVDR